MLKSKKKSPTDKLADELIKDLSSKVRNVVVEPFMSVVHHPDGPPEYIIEEKIDILKDWAEKAEYLLLWNNCNFPQVTVEVINHYKDVHIKRKDVERTKDFPYVKTITLLNKLPLVGTGNLRIHTYDDVPNIKSTLRLTVTDSFYPFTVKIIRESLSRRRE